MEGPRGVPEERGQEREEEEDDRVGAHTQAHRAVVAGAVDLLQEAGRDDEGGSEEHHVHPAGGSALEQAPIGPSRGGLHHRREAAGPGEDHGEGDREAGEHDHELDHVDPGRGQEAAGREIDRHHGAPREAARPLGHACHHV